MFFLMFDNANSIFYGTDIVLSASMVTFCRHAGMPPKKRSAALTDLPAELPFSPGQQTAELFASRSALTVASEEPTSRSLPPLLGLKSHGVD